VFCDLRMPRRRVRSLVSVLQDLRRGAGDLD
jgi:hypothetical protein